jgi:c-di-GMP-binding flagellar brake protein YcgR
MEERRKYLRLDLCTEVEYEILPMHISFLGETKNISAGGMCFLADREFKLDSALRLRFFLPDRERTFIESLARVVWQKKTDRGFLTGIEFRNLSPHLELRLNIFVLNFLKEVESYQEPSH